MSTSNELQTQLFPEFFRTNFVATVPMVFGYVSLVFGLRNFMKTRDKLELRIPLFFWSSGLAILSLCMFLGTFKDLVQIWLEHGFHHSLCEKWFLDFPDSRYWSAWYLASKVMEFGDTVFMVLRKQPLTFLHVYHHATAVMLTWYTGGREATVIFYFGLANTFIHVIMYTYYALKALRIKVPKFVSATITTLQLSQMLFGVLIACYAFKLHLTGNCSAIDTNSFIYLSIIYFTFFILFINFFYQSYVKNNVVSMKIKKK